MKVAADKKREKEKMSAEEIEIRVLNESFGRQRGWKRENVCLIVDKHSLRANTIAEIGRCVS